MLVVTIILVSVLSVSVHAWGEVTHRYIAQQVCNDFGCGACAADILNGSTAPDLVFHDNTLHHCYDNLSWNCTESKYYACPTKNDCPALNKTEGWLEKSKLDSGCQKWYDVGVALHYYSDSFVIWHKVQEEDYEKCHAPFESKINDRIEKGYVSWSVTQCNETATNEDISGIVRSFEAKIDSIVPRGSAVTGQVTGNQLDMNWVLIAAIMIIIVIVIVAVVLILRKKK